MVQAGNTREMFGKESEMLKIYGSRLCPDCVACKNSLDANAVNYEFIDITEGMKNLKAFLKLRDTDPVFTDARGNGYVGSPALVNEDGKITLDWEKYLSENGFAGEPGTGAGAACSIDGKGC